MKNDTDITEEQAAELEQFESEFAETAGAPEPEEPEPEANQPAPEEGEPAKPTEAEPEPEGLPAAEPEPSEKPEADLYPIPDHEKFGEYRGKKLTAVQLEETGLLRKFVTWQHQSMLDQSIREKNKDLEDQVKTLNARVEELTAPAEPEPEPPREMTPEEMGQFVSSAVAKYKPYYDKAAAAGAIEEDAVEFYPKMLCVLEHRLQSGQAQLTLFRNVLLALAEDYQGRFQNESIRSDGDYLLGVMDSVAGKDGFQFFKEGDARDQFEEWFGTPANGRGYDDLPSRFINEQIMEDAFMAFMRAKPELFIAPGPQPSNEKPAPRTRTKDNRHLAKGAGGGGPGGAGTKPILDELAEFEQEFERSLAR